MYILYIYIIDSKQYICSYMYNIIIYTLYICNVSMYMCHEYLHLIKLMCQVPLSSTS